MLAEEVILRPPLTGACPLRPTDLMHDFSEQLEKVMPTALVGSVARTVGMTASVAGPACEGRRDAGTARASPIAKRSFVSFVLLPFHLLPKVSGQPQAFFGQSHVSRLPTTR